ncbi:hypothetical protein EOC93_15620 [Mesorhizobium sp. M6A.T.Ce.TU.002.03.1.1]|uniref:DUF6361 family protein n=1 Tax=Mesorhizobium sp. M6A.T.Ce.TU.002.03.1.1 TaxID=2496782 RepID=UPI000FCC99B9|nr:DUF6361 family protein [Mesorhizobium sp. M6A.T.Ce.TU.002.03.1.1]RUU43252.1 hypothetical protein EOC93_15620 [Mesorhizobium sp. M6A.T.Ce.TU.002.03.1.1]
MNFLGWVDHDPRQEDEILRALGAAKGHDARDELGLASIRDSFADLFFPGLSTIQQRVRYFLFVQWCCEIAASQGEASRILSTLRENEDALIHSLEHLGEGKGVIGIESKENLKRTASEIYWNGLFVVGMRSARGNRRRWARQVASSRSAGRADNFNEEGAKSSVDLGFDPDRPGPPKGFPKVELDFTLNAEEANFLRGRLVDASVDSDRRGHEYNLFGTFARYRRKTNVQALWDHPRISSLKTEARDMVMLGGAFARVMYGAAILYNVCVARLLPLSESTERLRTHHDDAFLSWVDELNPADVILLARRIPDLQAIGAITRHRIDEKAIGFVRRWTQLCDKPQSLLNDQDANRLVSDREVYLKAGSGTSRIRSAKQRERWRGESGSQQMDFRWRIARSCLNDLAKPADA